MGAAISILTKGRGYIYRGRERMRHVKTARYPALTAPRNAIWRGLEAPLLQSCGKRKDLDIFLDRGMHT